MPEEQAAFREYNVPGVGTVVAHEGTNYHVALPDGRVVGFPAASGAPSEANSVADIAAAQVELASPASRKPGLLARTAARRWEREVGGITLDGVLVRTDRESQAMLAGAITFCDLEAQAVINWKAANGWQELGETGLRAIALEVGRHVQSCFTRERALAEGIAAATTHEQLDAIEAEVEAFSL